MSGCLPISYLVVLQRVSVFLPSRDIAGIHVYVQFLFLSYSVLYTSKKKRETTISNKKYTPKKVNKNNGFGLLIGAAKFLKKGGGCFKKGGLTVVMNCLI